MLLLKSSFIICSILEVIGRKVILIGLLCNETGDLSYLRNAGAIGLALDNLVKEKILAENIELRLAEIKNGSLDNIFITN